MSLKTMETLDGRVKYISFLPDSFILPSPQDFLSFPNFIPTQFLL